MPPRPRTASIRYLPAMTSPGTGIGDRECITAGWFLASHSIEVVRPRCVRGTCLARRRDVDEDDAAAPVAAVESLSSGNPDDVARAPFAGKSATDRRPFPALAARPC